MPAFSFGDPWGHHDPHTPLAAQRLNEREQLAAEKFDEQDASLVSVETRVGQTIQTTAVADASTQVGVGVFENTVDDWYGRWITEGNSPDSMGFSGSPTTTPATTTTSGVTFPLSNATIPVADTAQLNANGGSFTLGGKRVVYLGRSTASGAGNATGCYSLSTATGTVTSGTALGNTPKAWAPRVMYHQFGRDGKPLTGSVQLFAGIAASLVPSMDDSFEAGSFLAIMQDGGSLQSQHQPVTAGEFTAQLINNWQLPDGYTAPLVGGGVRTNVGGNSFAKNVLGLKVSPQFAGYQEQYDGIYQTVSGLDTWGQVDGSGSPITLPLGTITFKGATKRPPTPPAGGSVVVRLGANAQGIGGQLVTYTGVTGSGTTGTLTGCTGGTGNIADSSNIVNSARAINVVDVIQGQSGVQLGASGWSASIIAALKGGTDSIASMLAITGPTTAEITGGLTQLRLGAGSGQTKSIMQMFDTAGVNRWSVSAACTQIMNGGSLVMQSGGNNNIVIGNNDGYVQPGVSTARGGVIGLGGKINSGPVAPSFVATTGDYFLRTDTPSTANQRLYVCTNGAAGTWVGIA